MNRFFLCFTILTGFFILSCENEDCTSVSDNEIKISFVDSQTKEDKKLYLRQLEIKDNENLSFKKDTSFIAMKIKANPLDSAITFSLTYVDFTLDENDKPVFQDTLTENLTLGYRTTQKIITVDCGVNHAFSRLSALSEPVHFDSVKVVAQSLEWGIKTNVKIYY